MAYQVIVIANRDSGERIKKKVKQYRQDLK
jgi:hypothetical protein